MKNLIIIGAGGFGREVACYAEHCLGHNVDFVIKGFLDNNVHALDNFEGYPPVMGTVTEYTIEKNDVFICAIANIEAKIKNINAIREKGGHFITLIHKTAIIDKNSKIGMGCIICHNVYVNCDTEIYDYVTLQNDCMVGHDTKLYSWSHFHPRVFVGGGVKVEEGSLIGANACILPYKTIHEYARIGAAANITKDVPSHTTYIGNPAVLLYKKGTI